MEVSASSEDELWLSSTRKNRTSAPVFAFSTMHELYQRTLFLFWMGGTLDLFYSLFSWRALCFCWQGASQHEMDRPQYFHACSQMVKTALRLQDRRICRGQTKPLLDTTEPLKQGIQNIRSQLITFSRSINFFIQTSRADLHMNRSAELWQKEAPSH